ncbi:MAG: hypothetical protein OEM91_14485 [Hyphomicrobiales bacterium]|nr:hypothetical protein [Hyphomicrobiales bacterium]
MTQSTSFSDAETEAFAKRYGLVKLTKDHLARMKELAPIASDLGRDLPHLNHKSDAPAPTFVVVSKAAI